MKLGQIFFGPHHENFSVLIALSDHVVVMSDGRVEQTGPPEEVYNTPASEFVATFLGASNILTSDCTGLDGQQVALDVPGIGRLTIPRSKAPKLTQKGSAKLIIRAEKLTLLPEGTTEIGDISVPGTVEAVDYQGQAARYFVRVGDHVLQVINMIDEHPFAEGQSITVHLRGRDCAALPGSPS